MRGLVLAVSVVALAACTPIHMRTHVLHSAANEERPGTYMGLPLEDGQIVLSEEGGAHSLLFCLSADEFDYFTHAGILVFHDGVPYVYEMKGGFEGCFVDRPTDGIAGGLHRTPFEDYARAYMYFEILDPPPEVDKDAMVAWVEKRFEETVPFDAYFDYDEHEALYCTEFVQLALEAGGEPPRELRRVQDHPSIQRLFEWLGVDRERCLPAGMFHDPGRRVAALSQLPSLTAVQGYFAAKRELHDRFEEDQQLGNVFALESFAEIQLRPAVLDFLRRAARAADPERSPSGGEITAAVRALADDMFGLGPEPSAVAGGGHHLGDHR